MSTALQLEVNLFAWRVRCTSESHCYFSFSHSADVLFFLTFTENDYFTPKCSWNESTAIISNLCVWWLHQTPSEVIKSDQLQFKGLKKKILLYLLRKKSFLYADTDFQWFKCNWTIDSKAASWRGMGYNFVTSSYIKQVKRSGDDSRWGICIWKLFLWTHSMRSKDLSMSLKQAILTNPSGR